MKRSDALQPLSHDHHQVLFLSMRMSRTDADGADEVVEAFLKYWREDGQRHFREEEEVLYPVYAEYADVDHELLGQVLTEHIEVRALARKLEAGDQAARSPESLQALGQALSDHVRREERELFPLIEKSLPEEAYGYLTEAFVEAEAERHKSREDASS